MARFFQYQTKNKIKYKGLTILKLVKNKSLTKKARDFFVIIFLIKRLNYHFCNKFIIKFIFTKWVGWYTDDKCCTWEFYFIQNFISKFRVSYRKLIFFSIILKLSFVVMSAIAFKRSV